MLSHQAVQSVLPGGKAMTRRNLISMAASVQLALAAGPDPPVVPVHLVLDKLAKPWAGRERNVWADVWPEAARDVGRGGVRLEITQSPGEVGQPDGRQPVITGLD